MTERDYIKEINTMQNEDITTNNIIKDCYTIWENCLRVIRENIPEQDYQTWFEPVSPISLIDNILTVQIPNRFFYEHLEHNYIHLLRKALDNALGETGKLKYAIVAESQEDKPNIFHTQKTYHPTSTQQSNKANQYGNVNNDFSDIQKALFSDFQIQPHYTFDNFIEGECNRLARSTGFAVAEKPGVTAFNPLMLYGGSGLGKTHLLQAIGNHIKNTQEKINVLYVSSDRFTNQFVKFISNNDLQSFTNFYMQVDVLMIDDVQFLAGKDKTQEIFFHIFNYLHQSGKQIIMTSDLPPKDLKGIEERLIGRFKWGLTADLRQPDLETRMAIIHKKLRDENAIISDELIEYLANSIDSNVRELEGAIISLFAHAALNQGIATMAHAKNVVQQIVQSSSLNKEIGIDEIQKYTGEYMGVTVEEMKSKNRKKEIVLARQVAMYLAKEYTEFSLKSIGYHFGNRDHSTVIHAITCINDYLEQRKEVKMYIDDIKQKLKK